MSYIDVTGKTEDEAIRKALAQLGMDRDDVSVEILERAKSGFLGLGGNPARVRVTYADPEEEAATSEPEIPAVAAAPVKAERSEKVIVSAMKQSIKAFKPQLAPLTTFNELLDMPFEGRKLIAHCDEAVRAEGKQYLASTLKKGERALILIGPEGDFSKEEVARAVERGFEEITLGTQRLRTETAAVVAVTMVAVVNNQ